MKWSDIWGLAKKILKSKYFYFALVFFIINFFLTKELFDSGNPPQAKLFLLFEVLAEIILVAGIFIAKKKNFSIERLFLLLAIPLGMGYAFLLPLGQAPDEPAHIFRAYSIVVGDIEPLMNNEEGIGSYLPANLEDHLTWNPIAGSTRMLFSNITEPVSEDTEFRVYGGSANYNPLCYIPQIVGLLLSRIVRSPLIVSLFIARLFNLAAFIAIIYFAIKLAPKFKGFILFFMLTPIALQQAASFSPDALVISVSVFIVSYVMYLIYGKKGVMKKSEVSLLYILAIALGLLKLIYIPLLMTYFLIPRERFGEGKQKTYHAIAMIAAVAITGLGWMVFSSKYLITPFEGVDTMGQISFILGNPARFIGVLMRTLQIKMRFYAMSGFGMVLGTLQINLPEMYTYFSAGITLLLLAQNKERLKAKLNERIVYATVFFLTCLLIFLGLYLQWSTVGAPIVEGIQGRYFLPLLLLVPMFIYKPNPKETRPCLIKNEHILIYSVFLNVCALCCIIAANF